MVEDLGSDTPNLKSIWKVEGGILYVEGFKDCKAAFGRPRKIFLVKWRLLEGHSRHSEGHLNLVKVKIRHLKSI